MCVLCNPLNFLGISFSHFKDIICFVNVSTFISKVSLFSIIELPANGVLVVYYGWLFFGKFKTRTFSHIEYIVAGK